MKKPSFASMFDQFKDVWIAYDSKTFKVYATAKSASAALNRAWKLGAKKPTIIKAPKEHLARVAYANSL